MAPINSATTKDAQRDQARDALRAAGLRVTTPRSAMLAWLAEHPHATVDQISAGMRRRFGSVSTQALYDMLAAFADSGLVRCIQPAGHPTRYECRAGDNHHHVVCRQCGCIRDVDCAVGERPCLTPCNDRGFAVEVAEVVFWGYCPHCLDSSTAAPEPTVTSVTADVSAPEQSSEQRDHPS